MSFITMKDLNERDMHTILNYMGVRTKTYSCGNHLRPRIIKRAQSKLISSALVCSIALGKAQLDSKRKN